MNSPSLKKYADPRRSSGPRGCGGRPRSARTRRPSRSRSSRRSDRRSCRRARCRSASGRTSRSRRSRSIRCSRRRRAPTPASARRRTRRRARGTRTVPAVDRADPRGSGTRWRRCSCRGCAGAARAPEVTRRVVRTHVDQLRLVDRPCHAGVAAAPHEQRGVERREQVDVLGAARADRTDRIGTLRVEDGREARRAALDDLFEHDVGDGEPGVVRDRAGVVVDLDDHCRTRMMSSSLVERLAGERLTDGRRHRRRGRGRRATVVVVGAFGGGGGRRRRRRRRSAARRHRRRTRRRRGHSATSAARGRRCFIRVLSGVRSARRAGGACRTVGGRRRACRRRRRRSWVVRSTSVP